MDTRFFVISSFFVMYGAGFEACSFVLFGFGNILDCYTFSGVCLVITSAFRYLDIPNEFVMDHNPLTAILTNAFGFINRYLVYEFPKKRCSQFLHFHKSSDSANERVFPSLIQKLTVSKLMTAIKMLSVTGLIQIKRNSRTE